MILMVKPICPHLLWIIVTMFYVTGYNKYMSNISKVTIHAEVDALIKFSKKFNKIQSQISKSLLYNISAAHGPIDLHSVAESYPAARGPIDLHSFAESYPAARGPIAA